MRILRSETGPGREEVVPNHGSCFDVSIFEQTGKSRFCKLFLSVVLSVSTGGGYDSSSPCPRYYPHYCASKLCHEELSRDLSCVVVDLAYYCSSVFPVHAQTEKTSDGLPVERRLYLKSFTECEAQRHHSQEAGFFASET